MGEKIVNKTSCPYGTLSKTLSVYSKLQLAVTGDSFVRLFQICWLNPSDEMLQKHQIYNLMLVFSISKTENCRQKLPLQRTFSCGHHGKDGYFQFPGTYSYKNHCHH